MSESRPPEFVGTWATDPPPTPVPTFASVVAAMRGLGVEPRQPWPTPLFPSVTFDDVVRFRAAMPQFRSHFYISIDTDDRCYVHEDCRATPALGRACWLSQHPNE
jgi:hypothetical protein